MLLGIEIGGTKLQLAVGAGDGSPFVDFRRLNVDPRRNAEGILEQIHETGRELITRHGVTQLGIGFGGPVDASRGRTIKSHQIAGWEIFDLVAWCERSLGIPTTLGNDCDVASLAEARFGAGRSCRSVFYMTVGTGVGGGFVVDGKLMGEGRPASAEIGHLRPGLEALDASQTVESMASGWAIAQSAREEICTAGPALSEDAQSLRDMCDGKLDQLTTIMIGRAARTGNEIAKRAIGRACLAIGWALAQAATLLAPEVIVVGGGVSLLGEELFFEPVRNHARQYIFPPLAQSLRIVKAELGEEVVVHGALAIAAPATKLDAI